MSDLMVSEATLRINGLARQMRGWKMSDMAEKDAEIERLRAENADYEQRNNDLYVANGEQVERIEQLQAVVDAAKAVAKCEGQTLIGRAPESEYDPVTTPSNEQRAHEYGAYKAFNQCAALVKPALAALDTVDEKGQT